MPVRSSTPGKASERPTVQEVGHVLAALAIHDKTVAMDNPCFVVGSICGVHKVAIEDFSTLSAVPPYSVLEPIFGVPTLARRCRRRQNSRERRVPRQGAEWPTFNRSA